MMQITMTFDSEDMHDMELLRRHNVADKMAGLLYDLCHPGRGVGTRKVGKGTAMKILRWCEDDGIDFSEIYS